MRSTVTIRAPPRTSSPGRAQSPHLALSVTEKSTRRAGHYVEGFQAPRPADVGEFLRYPKEKAITGLLNEISSQAGVNYGLMASSVVLVVIPVLLVYVALQKHIIKGLTAGAIKG